MLGSMPGVPWSSSPCLRKPVCKEQHTIEDRRASGDSAPGQAVRHQPLDYSPSDAAKGVQIQQPKSPKLLDAMKVPADNLNQDLF